MFDFNDATGVIGNPRLLSSAYFPYGLEFSGSGDFLYVSEWSPGSSIIYQYNMNAVNIAQSQTAIGNVTSPGQTAAALQRAPDDKIYVAIFVGLYLGVIQNPELQGTACGFNANAVNLGGPLCQAGLPNTIAYGCGPKHPDAVEEPGVNDLISVYPNPAGEWLHVNCSALNADVRISIYSSTGALVESEYYLRPGTVNISLLDYAAGFYTLTVDTGTEHATRSFVIAD